MENIELKKKIFENRKLIVFNIIVSAIASISMLYLLSCYIYIAVNLHHSNFDTSDIPSIAAIFQLLWIFVWVLNTIIYFKLLKKYKNQMKKSMTILFILSFFFAGMVPIILGITALVYMKENNKRNYTLWVYEEKKQKMEKKIYKFEKNFDY